MWRVWLWKRVKIIRQIQDDYSMIFEWTFREPMEKHLIF